MTPDTQPYLDALTQALAASNTPALRKQRERLAAISREAEVLSAAITEADARVTEAEKALAAHLDAKHGGSPPAAILSDPEPAPVRDLAGTLVEDDLLDGSITEDAHGRYEARSGVWVRVSEVPA